MLKSSSLLKIRIIVLALSLVGVFATINKLKSGDPTNMEFFNLFAASGPKLPSPESKDWNWCHTRVSEILWTNKVQSEESWRIFQKGMDWHLVLKQIDYPMDQIVVEKWFAKNCISPVQAYTADTLLNFDADLKLLFVDSSQLELQIDSKNMIMRWENSLYHAPKLIPALIELAGKN